MAAELLLQAAPYVIQGLQTVLPFLSSALNQGSANGSSSNASSQASQSTTNTSGGQSGYNQSVTQGNTQGISNLWNSALGTPTGSNWQQAFAASQSSATTANNLQNSQWTMAQAMNGFSSMIANLGNLWSQTSARSYNRTEAEAQRQWTQEMRKTAYQDTVQDLKAAGLNPILAASRGATETGTGATATSSPGNFSAMTSAAVPSAHAANAQSMYDYGNNTMQFMNTAMQSINSAKQFGYQDFAQSMYQMADNILAASQSSSAEYAQKTENIAEQHLGQVLDTRKTAAGGGGRSGQNSSYQPDWKIIQK